MTKIDNLSEQDFDNAGNSIRLWIYKANQLLASSRFLQINCIEGRLFLMDMVEANNYSGDENNNFFDISLMLRGMALECFLKAILIKNGKLVFKNGKIKNKYNQHLLKQMAKDSKIRLNCNEEELLSLLSIKIKLGRYPVLQKCSEYNSLPVVPNAKKMGKDNKLHPYRGQYWNSKLENVFELLLLKISSLLSLD